MSVSELDGTEDNAGSTGDFEFLIEMERAVEMKPQMTEFEWSMRNRLWENQRDQLMSQMHRNNIWSIPIHGANKEMGTANSTRTIEAATSDNKSSVDIASLIAIPKLSLKKEPSFRHRAVWKVPKMNQLELFKYLQDWDKASYAKRDKLIMQFIQSYDTKDNVYDTDSVFSFGGSLIFCRFCVGLHICFLKHRKVWHYYDALGIFIRSLQGNRYAEEFLRLGGMNYIIQVVRVEESTEIDKLRACNFLLQLMKCRSGHAVKQFICDTPHLLESLVDSLTMCKNRQLIESCGLIFENLCVEIPPHNIPIICGYVMHALPCDFNPLLQAMAFRVLEGYIRLKPSLSVKCIKPILDNLNTTDTELLVSMSSLSLVILQTRYGDELIGSLVVAAEGVQLREVFKSVTKPQIQHAKTLSSKDMNVEFSKIREKREKVRVRQVKQDLYTHQASALFILNYMMTHKVEFCNEFVKKGIFGLSLKTLGACPHWEVQGQGVTMVKFLFSVSMECALSYYMMLPPKMLELILTKPEECLRYFTSPICVRLRKLGRFALRFWQLWVDKVISVAKLYAKGTKIPQEVFEQTQMARTVYEIHQEIADLLENPVMEAFPKEEEDLAAAGAPPEHTDFFDSSDEEHLAQYKDGEQVIMGDERFEEFRSFLEEQDEYQIIEDPLDQRLNGDKSFEKEDADDKDVDDYTLQLLHEMDQKGGSDEDEEEEDDQNQDNAILDEEVAPEDPPPS